MQTLLNPNLKTSEFHFPETGQRVRETATLLAIDDAMFTLKHNVCLYLTKPSVRREPILIPEPINSNAPDNLATQFYGTVLQEEGLFRMWYYACHLGKNWDASEEELRQLAKFPGRLFQGPLCYAESEDGIHWVKPNLGQVSFKGSSANNAIALPHAIVSAATVIKDEEEADPQRRYKMVYEFWPEYSEPPLEGIGLVATCATAVSSDGLQWTVQDIPYPNEFVEHASFYKHGGLYIINSQNFDMQVPGEGGTNRGRQGFARFGTDFENWLEGSVESFALPEPINIKERGISGLYDQVHLGIGAASFGTVCVGLYGIWHNAEFTKDFTKISGDLGLVISNDGLRFREPVKGHVFLSRDESPASPCEQKSYNTILTQANGILNVGDETRIYHGRWRNAGNDGDEENYRAEVGLATLPRDRWGALGLFPESTEGSFWSSPITIPEDGAELTLNAEGVTGIEVEMASERYELLPEFSGCNSGRTMGREDGLDCAVTWPGNELQSLGGRTVRFRIRLRSEEGVTPRVYAFSLKVTEEAV